MKKTPFLFLSLIVILAACNKEWVTPYEPQFTADFRQDRQNSNDTIVLHCQGGPARKLLKEEASDIFSSFPYSYAAVHQAQTKDSTILERWYINQDDAKRINDESADILARAITHFKNQKKFVVVHGFSFGNWVVLRNIAKHGIVADRYIVGGGRLDVEEAYLDLYQKHKFGGYIDGKTILADKYLIPKSIWATTQLGADMLSERYTNKLKDKDLKKLMVYSHSEDYRVGGVTAAEIAFLKSKNATILVSPGDHDITVNDKKEIQKFVRKKL